MVQALRVMVQAQGPSLLALLLGKPPHRKTALAPELAENRKALEAVEVSNRLHQAGPHYTHDQKSSVRHSLQP